jgi:hypothetical protein
MATIPKGDRYENTSRNYESEKHVPMDILKVGSGAWEE